MQDKRQISNELADAIDKLVTKYSGSQLWEEAVRLAVKANPRIAQDVLLTIRDNKQIRSSLNLEYNRDSMTRGKTMQLAIRIPESVDSLLCAVDPATFPLSQHEPHEAKKYVKKLYSVMPEFFLPQSL